MTPEQREIVVQRLTAELGWADGDSDLTDVLDGLEACGYQIIGPAERTVLDATRGLPAGLVARMLFGWRWVDAYNELQDETEWQAWEAAYRAYWADERAADCKETDQ